LPHVTGIKSFKNAQNYVFNQNFWDKNYQTENSITQILAMMLHTAILYSLFISDF